MCCFNTSSSTHIDLIASAKCKSNYGCTIRYFRTCGNSCLLLIYWSVYTSNYNCTMCWLFFFCILIYMMIQIEWLCVGRVYNICVFISFYQYRFWTKIKTYLQFEAIGMNMENINRTSKHKSNIYGEIATKIKKLIHETLYLQHCMLDLQMDIKYMLHVLVCSVYFELNMFEI